MQYGKTILAAATALSLAGSATPAFALSFHLDGKHEVKAQMGLLKKIARLDGETQAELKVSALKRCSEVENSDDRKECERLVQVYFQNQTDANAKALEKQFVKDLRKEVKAEIKSEVKGHAQTNTGASIAFWSRAQASAEKSIDRLVKHVAKIAKRICVLQDSKDDAVKTCLAKAKVDVQARVTAMINAAFGS